MKTVKLPYLAIFSLCLLACTENPENQAQYPAPVVYDYRDEKNQDAYSRYRRANKVDWVIFNSDEIRKTLDKQTIPDGIHGKMYIEKIEARRQRTLDTFTSKEEVINRHYSRFQGKLCEQNNVQGLICIENNMGRSYYYLPNVNKELAKKRKFPSFIFSCDKEHNPNCRVIQILSSEPYNIGLSIHFNNPQNIFYILDYVDKHFYDTLGIHLWQAVPKQNK